jgi:predicted XRE-type DNA-binding protein
MTKLVKAKVIRKPEIFTKLKELVETGQTFGVTQQQLSTKLKIKRETVSDYLKIIYAEIPDEDIKHIQIKIQTMFDRLFREAQRMLIEAKEHKEKAEAMRILLLMMEKFTNFLEQFGIKEKVADRINLNAEVTTKSISINIIDHRSQIKQIEND